MLVPPRFGTKEFAIVDTLFKHHASCYLTHAALDAIESLATQQNTDAPAAVAITVNPALLDVCAIPEPTTGLEAKFSLKGVAALALL